MITFSMRGTVRAAALDLNFSRALLGVFFFSSATRDSRSFVRISKCSARSAKDGLLSGSYIVASRTADLKSSGVSLKKDGLSNMCDTYGEDPPSNYLVKFFFGEGESVFSLSS